MLYTYYITIKKYNIIMIKKNYYQIKGSRGMYVCMSEWVSEWERESERVCKEPVKRERERERERERNIKESVYIIKKYNTYN